MTFRLGLLASIVGLASALPFSADAATRALVVGVSGYPNLAESLRLVGPKNDSREFANMLARQGVPAGNISILADNITGLSDGLTSAGPATHEAVLSALDRLAETSQPGDLVVFYFSGHGSQTTDLDGDEQGGNDEIFLPYDVGKFEDGSVRNALVDDELNVRIRKILDKGADFFGVIDACHSATGFRALGDDDSRVRQVDPAELGVPDVVALENRPAFTRIEGERHAGAGRAAFFYAAQEIEVAREQKPKNGDTDEFFGVFTYNLLKRINATPGLTYRALHQAVVDDLKRGNLMSSQTPELEGDLIDEPFLRLSDAPERQQWPIAVGKVQAGELSGLTAGTILALYDDPADADDKVLAYGMVETAGATKSIVVPVTYPCADANADGSCKTAPDEAKFKTGRFARIVERGVDFSLALSEPVRLDPNDGFDYGPAIAALSSAVATPELSKRVSLRKSGYDIAVALTGGKLAFAPSAGLIDANGPGSSPRLTLPETADGAKAAVQSAISRMAKALALQRIGGAEGTKSVGLAPEIKVRKARAEALSDGVCASEDAAYEAAAVADPQTRLAPCDIVQVRMENAGKKPIDVTVLLVSPDFSITPVWPSNGEANRIHIGESKTADILQVDPATTNASEERLVFVTVPGVSKSHVVFDDLEQEGVRAGLGDEAPEVAAARAALEAGLNDMDRSVAAQPARVEEEMSVDVRSFFVGQGIGR